MKTKTIIYIFFSLLLVMGCKKEPQYEIYENHDISSCGIEDPLKNIEWLTQYCNNIVTNSLIKGYEYSQMNVYSCSNELLFNWSSASSPSPQYKAFFSDKKIISKIWSVREVLEP